MKKLFYQFLKWLILNLVKMYTDYQVKSISEILNKIVKSQNNITISSNSQINKLIYDLDLDTCSLQLIIELIEKNISFRFSKIDPQLNSDVSSLSNELSNLNSELEKNQPLIESYFLILVKK